MVALASVNPNTLKPPSSLTRTGMAVPVASWASATVPSRRVLEKDKVRIAQLCQSGQTSLEVAEEVGVAKSTVLRVLHERGIPIRPWGRHR